MEVNINFIKKVKAKDNTTWFKKWDVVSVIKETYELYVVLHNNEIQVFNKQVFEETKEDEPKFKIWDPVTFYNDDNKIYWFIAWFDTFSNEYKISTDTRWYKEDELTLTKEEDIKKYFKQ